MDRIVAYCGLVCSGCEAYLATQAGDQAALEAVAAHWREEYSAPGITVASVMCDGCLGTDGQKCGHCGECDIRACGMAAGLETCAACESYPCDKLERFFGSVPDACTTLDALRPQLAVPGYEAPFIHTQHAQRRQAMDRIIAYCGIVCSECPSYIHTQTLNMEELEKLAARAREEHGVADATAESAMCDGCLGDGRKIGYCAECGVRACGVQRGVANCAECADYACETLEGFLQMVPQAHEVLDGLRA